MTDRQVEDLTELVLQAQKGDALAFEELVRLTQRSLFYTVLRVVQDQHTADDLVQEVFIKAFQSLPELKTPEFFKAWIHRIAMNRAIDTRRSAKKAAEKVFLVDDFFNTAVAEEKEPRPDPREQAKLETAVQEAIADLPDNQKSVLSLTMDKNMSQEEIAQIMECPVGTIKSRLHHARKTLKEKLRRWFGDIE
jgi:RNA polymerase sigma-70 factor, ECF subfamily